MRAVPIPRPWVSKMRPKAIADAMPEQKTKISVESEKPKRPGIQLTHQSPGVCDTKMTNIATPRKKSRRGSRSEGESLEFVHIIVSLSFADKDREAAFLKSRCKTGLE